MSTSALLTLFNNDIISFLCLFDNLNLVFSAKEISPLENETANLSISTDVLLYFFIKSK